MRWRLAFCAALLALAGCKEAPREQVRPALWEVTGAQGEKAWLFGTIHALPEPVDWRSPAIDKALAASDRLVLEIDNGNDPAAIRRVFVALATSKGLPPLAERVAPARRAELKAVLDRFDLNEEDFAGMETWAAALTLSRAVQGDVEGEYGMEASLMTAAKGKPVAELEGTEPQLRLFDRLPEKEQVDLLLAIVAEASAPEDGERLGEAWKTGDMAQLAIETRTGLLAAPELRAALLVNRNLAWAEKLDVLLEQGAHPLVAVGAAHMAGPDGLPALLAAEGYAVKRIQ